MLQFNYHKNLFKPSDIKLEYLRNQVRKLHNTFQPVQKSKEWYEMRNGLLTASDWGKILEAKTDVLLKKCGEDKFIGGAAIDWGNKYEQVANLIYQNRNNIEVLEFGCLRHPVYDYLGASPDGITPDGIMVEIKCPYSRKISGIPKYEYWCQVQGQLEVCDLDRCDFIECCIKEYTNEEEYLIDNYNGNYELNKFTNEKGVIAEFYRKNDKTYFNIYSKVSLIGEELKEWKNNVKLEYETNDIILFGFTYWHLEEVSCIPIYRNQEWFYNARPILENYWNIIIKYRNLGLSKFKEDVSNGTVYLEKMNFDKPVFEKKSYDKNKTEMVKIEAKKENKTDNKKQKKLKDYIDITNNAAINLNTNNINTNEGHEGHEGQIRQIGQISQIDKISNNTNNYEDDDFTFDMNVSMFS